jgi:hypothetical protein
MYQSGTASKWQDSGVKWVVFFQDTNALAFVTLPAMLGVSVSLELEVNSLTVPRVAKQAVGAITKLVHEDGRTMTVNVEYNQLDPLLRATGSPDGDVNEPATGLSSFPGNTNQLVFKLSSYVRTLRECGGAMPEFVNPKYADATKTTFKKPTRLECMMQDYPKLLGSEAKVGFVMAPLWLCYSPCKNNAADAAAACAAGVPTGSAYSCECDQFYVYAELLRRMGAAVGKAADRIVQGVAACPGPQVVLSPESAVFPSDLRRVFPAPSRVRITGRSTLIIQGDVTVRSLRLDGALRLIAESGAVLRVRSPMSIASLLAVIGPVEARRDSSVVVNAGYELRELQASELELATEIVKMRGYVFQKKEERILRAKASASARASRASVSSPARSNPTVTEVIFVGPAAEPIVNVNVGAAVTDSTTRAEVRSYRSSSIAALDLPTTEPITGARERDNSTSGSIFGAGSRFGTLLFPDESESDQHPVASSSSSSSAAVGTRSTEGTATGSDEHEVGTVIDDETSQSAPLAPSSSLAASGVNGSNSSRTFDLRSASAFASAPPDSQQQNPRALDLRNPIHAYDPRNNTADYDADADKELEAMITNIATVIAIFLTAVLLLSTDPVKATLEWFYYV